MRQFEANDLRDALAEDLRVEHERELAEQWTDGMQFGAKVENKVALRAVVGALLVILGKDQGDGVIDLGAAGRWYPAADTGQPELAP